MERSEFEAWKAETEKAVLNWNQDAVFFFNRKDILLYKGGLDGVFVLIERSGAASIGYYEGAFPHIGEAVFRTVYSKNFESQVVATETVCEKLNLGNAAEYYLGLRFGQMMPWVTA